LRIGAIPMSYPKPACESNPAGTGVRHSLDSPFSIEQDRARTSHKRSLIVGTTTREVLAEFLGTFVLIVFGTAVVAQVSLSNQANGSYLSINLGWGLAVMMGVYVAGGVSGAHLNPAVTLTLAVRRGFPWHKVVPYVVAQLAGAFTGALVTFITYREAFDRFDGGVRQIVGPQATAGIFATYPQPFLTTFPGGFLDQVVGTALLLLMIFAISDTKNLAPDSKFAPLVVGLIVTLIGMTFGYNAGYAINPARDLGPRFFTAVGGWGTEVFRAGNGWWWVPIAGPLVGGMIGGFTYDLLVSNRRPD
jgi:MIP family channel proteins